MSNGNHMNGSIVPALPQEELFLVPTPLAKKNDALSKIPLRFLFVSYEGLIGDVAWALHNEGHETKIWIKDPTTVKEVFDGFLEKVPSWEAWVSWADVVVFDDTGFGKEADALRAKGKRVVGGSVYTDNLEEDREFGQGEMKRTGMTILPHWDFSNHDEAILFLRANPGRYVYKPSGSIPSEQKGIFFIGQEDTGNDLIEILEHNKKTLAKKIKRFQLQKFASGVEIAVGAFFNGTDFLLPINVNFEHKKLFPGDIGPNTGEMGTLMFWSNTNKLFKMTLERMKPLLQTSGYVGYVDINCIVNGKGVYPLEFTNRFGYPTISVQLEGLTMPVAEFLFRLAQKEMFEIKTKRGFQIGVVVGVPPFPYHDRNESDMYDDLSIIFKKPSYEGIHLGDVKFVEGDWRLAGGSGYALVATGSGTTVAEARRMVYNRIDNIILQNKFYRTDIGLSWSTDSDKLQTWGYL